MKIGLVIPAYNEEKRIGNTLNAYSLYFEKLRKGKKLDYEILVSVNATTDRTKDIVSNFKKKNKRINYLDLKEPGKGNAIIQGFNYFLDKKSEFIGFVDADMATRPEDFCNLLTSMGNYDCIIASRYIPGAKVYPKPTLPRKIASRMFNFAIRAILFMPYKDTQCGAKIIKREALNQSIKAFTRSQWDFDIDLLYTIRKNGFKIKEYPTRWSDREYSKINFIKSGPMMLLGVIRLRLLNSPMRRFIRVYDILKNSI